MGKGGTKFHASAIGERDRMGGTVSYRQLKHDMEHYLETGRHPELEEAASTDVLQPLPEPDPVRPHVYMEFKFGSRVLGRLVIELFTDVVPLAAAEFRRRCSRGATGGFQGTRVHKILHNLALFGGKSSRYSNGGVNLKRSPTVRHVERGVVSIALTGEEFFIPMCRALVHDTTHQVIGRIALGEELLEVLNDLPTNMEDVPQPALVVSAVGVTDATGAVAGGGEGGAEQTPEEAAAQMAQEADEARASVKDALDSVLAGKRKQQEAVPAASKRKATGGMMQGLLGDGSSSSSEEEDA